MTIQVYNDNGETILDALLPHYHLALTGSINVTTANANITVNFPSAVQNPMMYVRQQSLNTALHILGVGPSSFTYRASATGVFDYRVYSSSTNLPAADPYGLQVYSSAGVLTYQTSYNTPDIRQRTLILNGTDTGATVTDYTTTLVANDGGRPWMLGNPFHVCAIQQTGPNTGQIFSIGFYWKSATTFTVGTTSVAAGGPTNAPLGYRPRYVYLIR